MKELNLIEQKTMKHQNVNFLREIYSYDNQYFMVVKKGNIRFDQLFKDWKDKSKIYHSLKRELIAFLKVYC